MSKDYCHYEVLWPVMVGLSTEDGLLLSICPAKEDTRSLLLPLTRQQRIFRWKGERKAGLLLEDEKETLQWQKMGAALSKLAKASRASREAYLYGIPTDIILGADDDDYDLGEPFLICDDLGQQVVLT